MKKITYKFDRPLEWKEAKELDLGVDPLAVTYWTTGGSTCIEGFKCYKHDFEKISAKLKIHKVSFKIHK